GITGCHVLCAVSPRRAAPDLRGRVARHLGGSCRHAWAVPRHGPCRRRCRRDRHRAGRAGLDPRPHRRRPEPHEARHQAGGRPGRRGARLHRREEGSRDPLRSVVRHPHLDRPERDRRRVRLSRPGATCHDRPSPRTIRPHRARQPPRCRARPYPGTLMSSLFDDLSLPDAFRRLDGVSVTPQTRDAAPAAPPGGDAPVEEPPPYEDEPPYEEEPPDDEAPHAEHDLPRPPAEVAQAPHPADRPALVAPGVGAAGLTALTDALNPAQREAVEHRGSPLLIVAGAGSGKTRVLTRRIAHLLGSGEALPGEILAITFTNKAAAEMRERVGELVGPAARSMWVSTFHSACVRILRRDAAAAGLKSSFTIYDSADSLRLITTIAKDLELDTKKNAPRALASRISSLKNDLTDPIDFADQAEGAKNPFERTLARIYTTYTERLRQANAVDFDDLIGLTV